MAQIARNHEVVQAIRSLGREVKLSCKETNQHAAKQLAELEAQLDQAFQQSKLPEDRDRTPVNDLLLRLRLSESHGD